MIYHFEGLKRIEVQEAHAGDIVGVTGFEEVFIGESIVDGPDRPALPHKPIDPPTIQMEFAVNDGPLGGNDGTLSGTLAKQVFEIMLETGEAPGRIVEERGLKQTSDTGAIEQAIAEVMAANADKVAEYRSGKDKLFGFFVGQTMKAMAGKANPQVVNELLKKALG